MNKITITRAKKKAWRIFSEYIRTRDAIETTGSNAMVLCITCDKPYPAFGKGCAQAGHFIPGRGNAVLIDERFVNAQCYNCNINLKGNWVKYEEKMVERWGADAVAQAKIDSRIPVAKTATEWLEIAEIYKEKLDHLTNN